MKLSHNKKVIAVFEPYFVEKVKSFFKIDIKKWKNRYNWRVAIGNCRKINSNFAMAK